MTSGHGAARLAGGLLALLLGAGAAVAAPLTVIDISAGGASTVERLSLAAPPSLGWIELDRHLVLVGDYDRRALGLGANRVLTARADIDPSLLYLRAHGCDVHADDRGLLLARGGRWELRLLSESERRAVQRDGGPHWQPAPHRASLARRWSAPAKGLAVEADAAVQAVVDRIDAARWFADVTALAAWDRHSHGTTSLEAARDWIGAQFQALGLEVSLQPFQMPGPGGVTLTRHNVIGTIEGSTRPDRWVVVGAHYDSRNQTGSSTTPTPGAEDNATGCAGVIELARALLPSLPARSIAFVCYAGEEQGLYGSYAHVDALDLQGQLDAVDLVVIMDMIGYSADSQVEALFEGPAAHLAYLQHFGAMAAIYAPDMGVVTSTSPFGSDHMPYINQGLRAALAIDNDWDIYPYYHRSNDVPANLGPHAQAMGGAILRTNAAVIADLGGLYTALLRDGFEDPAPPED